MAMNRDAAAAGGRHRCPVSPCGPLPDLYRPSACHSHRFLVLQARLGEHEDCADLDHGEEPVGLVVERRHSDLTSLTTQNKDGERTDEEVRSTNWLKHLMEALNGTIKIEI